MFLENKANPTRETRYPFAGRLHVLIDASPWRLSLCLRGINVSATGVAGLITRDQVNADFTGHDLNAILARQTDYQLQLDDSSGQHSLALVSASLVRRRLQNDGLELAFTFADDDGEVQSFIDELSLKTTPAGSFEPL